MSDLASIEPKTGLATGVWMNDDKGMAYKGTLPALLQFYRKSEDHMVEPMVISRCPPCERHNLPMTKLKRWLIIPP